MESDKLKVALLVDNKYIEKWREDSLVEISDLIDIDLILSCTNTVSRRHVVRHAAYYVLNIISIRSSLTRKRETDVEGRRFIEFSSRYEEGWQWIPDEVVEEIRKSGCKVVIKFGMSLLKMDNLSGIDILSFHHGDPRHYRGRPAGFYEMMNNEESVGFMVQKLSNVLDGGEVIALGYEKLYKYSYSQTIRGLFSSSPALLRQAINNYVNDKRLHIVPEGNNYRLPSNWLVTRFCARLLMYKFRRIVYGAFWEKRWNIVLFSDVDPVSMNRLVVSDGDVPLISKKYNFYADSFLSNDGSSVLVEALVRTTGRGEIIELDSDSLAVQRVLVTGGHASYPYTFVEDEVEYLIPEVAGHSAPYLQEVGCERKIPLRGLEDQRLVDPSLLKFQGRYYLFSGHPISAASMLNIYVADSIQGPYNPHPMNPVVINPLCARMGGRLLEQDGKLYRFGQDNSSSYGNGLRIMEILQLSSRVYEEREIGQIRFLDASGPHTVDVKNNRAVFDFYQNKFSLLAGYRRMVARLHARLVSGRP